MKELRGNPNQFIKAVEPLTRIRVCPVYTTSASARIAHFLTRPLLPLCFFLPSLFPSLFLIVEWNLPLDLNLSLPLPPHSTMSSSTHFVDPNSFDRQSEEFMAWLSHRPGVRVSSKIHIADLRSMDAGRGVGM